ncbi:MAG: autoinducer 2-degrading protein [Verrucomicrobiales bacterium]|jgi:autoinducer 2-degrading protein
MLAIVVTIEVNPGRADDLIAALEFNAAGSRQEPSCLKWEWSRHISEPDKFAIYELYTDAEAFAAHKASEHFAEWVKMIDGVMANKTAGQYEVLGEDSR